MWSDLVDPLSNVAEHVEENIATTPTHGLAKTLLRPAARSAQAAEFHRAAEQPDPPAEEHADDGAVPYMDSSPPLASTNVAPESAEELFGCQSGQPKSKFVRILEAAKDKQRPSLASSHVPHASMEQVGDEDDQTHPQHANKDSYDSTKASPSFFRQVLLQQTAVSRASPDHNDQANGAEQPPEIADRCVEHMTEKPPRRYSESLRNGNAPEDATTGQEMDVGSDSSSDVDMDEVEARDKAAEAIWEASLKPRHRGLLNSLVSMSRQLVAHVAKSENVVLAEIRSYVDNGHRILKDMNKKHIEQVGKYRGQSGRTVVRGGERARMVQDLKALHDKTRGGVSKHFNDWKKDHKDRMKQLTQLKARIGGVMA
jgi:hypothetical protein